MKSEILTIAAFLLTGYFTGSFAQSPESAPFIKKAPVDATKRDVTPTVQPAAKFVTPSSGKPEKKTLPASSESQQNATPMLRRANSGTK